MTMRRHASDGCLSQFLMQYPSCVKFWRSSPTSSRGLNWLIGLAEKDLNNILSDQVWLGKMRDAGSQWG